MARQEDQFFAVVPPGFEGICARELMALGIPANSLRGGVEFSGGLQELYLANLWLRVASRVLVRLGEVTARDFPTLYKRLVRLPWGRFVKPGTPCDVRVSCHRSRLSHSGRVAETVHEALARALGSEPVPGQQRQKILVRLTDDRCQVSIDSSGDLLHRRGYRRNKVTAPLRETLAAGSLLALGYDGRTPLIDAMTGSGSFAIEAALIACRRAPGIARQFAFMGWPRYREGLWEQLCQEAGAQEASVLFKGPIYAVDNNPQAIDAAQQNAMAAGVAEHIVFSCSQMQQLTAEQPTGLIICNPPYGERIGRTAALQKLYRSLGRLYREEFSGWDGALVCPDRQLVRTTGVDFQPVLQFSNGGIRVMLLKTQ